MQSRNIVAAGLAGLVLAGLPWATSLAYNVALNKPVTLIQGTQFNNGVTAPAPLSVITDGVFVPEGTCFSCAYGQSVQWANPQPNNVAFTLEINLEGNFNITGALIQADNNDTYQLNYWNETSNTWQPLYTANPVCCSGLTTRPGPDQTTFAAVGPVLTDAVELVGVSGDAGLAVSEVQLDGTPAPVPLPATSLLMLSGLSGMVGLAWRRRRVPACSGPRPM